MSHRQPGRAQFISFPQPVIERPDRPDSPRKSGNHAIVRQKTRILSLVALLLVAFGLLQLGDAAYHAVNDPLVAPIAFSPDSELVLPSKLTLSRMISDHQSLEARLDESSTTVKANEQAIRRLRELQSKVSNGLKWTDDVSAKIESATSGELRVISEQKRLIAQNIEAQRAYVDELKKSLHAGLVHRTDVLREEAELNRMRLSALQVERERLGGQGELYQHKLTQEALHNAKSADALLSPEMIEQSDHLVRIELELLKLEGDQRARTNEVQALTEQLKKADELIAQVKARPVFAAVEAEQNVAFVPYAQINGVQRGAALYDCDLWSIFFCRPVGSIARILPGEVSMNDPWGSPARGQYAVLTLTDTSAAKSKVLHVRAADALD